MSTPKQGEKPLTPIAFVADAYWQRIDERNRARTWAVHYEQAAAEYGRRVRLALVFLEDLVCECDGRAASQTSWRCPRCVLVRILAGDE